ncbi:methyl-accepting chemotaxis protein [Deltaproteobacteria bacterium TL4]
MSEEESYSDDASPATKIKLSQRIQQLTTLTMGKKITAMIMLFMITIVIIIGLAISGANTFSINSKEIQAVDAVQAEILEAEAAMLKSRQREKAFFLNTDMKLVEQVFALVEKSVGYLESASEGDIDSALRGKIDKMKQGLDDYKAEFKEVVRLKQQLGLSSDQGLQGALRKNMQDIESILLARHQDRLMLMLFMISHYEKDYLLRGGEELVTLTGNKVTELKEQLGFSELEPNVKQEVASLLENGLTQFNRLVSLNKQIFQKITAFDEKMAEFEPLIEEIGKGSNERSSQLSSAIHAYQSNHVRLLVILGGIALLITALFGYLIERSITKPVDLLIQNIEEIAQGNFTKRIKILSKDEMGRLGRVFNGLVEHLASMMRDISKSSTDINGENERLSQSIGGVSETVHQLSEMAVTQAAAIEETSSAVREIQSGVAMTAKYAQDADTLGQEADDESKEGVKAVKQMQESMQSIHDGTFQITNFVSSISEIANQTNLLSLNAAIEAAKAGEQGKGFAVVADEVRRLAENSAKVTSEIQEIIQDTGQRVGKGQEAVTMVHQRLQAISEKIAETAVLVTHITTATAEQTSALNEISHSMDELAETSSRVEASAEKIDVEIKGQVQVSRKNSEFSHLLLEELKEFQF